MNQNENVVATGTQATGKEKEKKGIMGFIKEKYDAANEKMVAKERASLEEAQNHPNLHRAKKWGFRLGWASAGAAVTELIEHGDEIHVSVGNGNKGGNSRRMAAMQNNLRANER